MTKKQNTTDGPDEPGCHASHNISGEMAGSRLAVWRRRKRDQGDDKRAQLITEPAKCAETETSDRAQRGVRPLIKKENKC